MRELKQYLKDAIIEFVTENKAYDELISLEKWYKEENKKLDTQFVFMGSF